MQTAIETAFAPLDRVQERLPLQTILDWFERHPLAIQDLASHLVFHYERYVRNLLYTGPTYQALVLCWRNGQRSPIHNHRGSNCGVKVLRGTATESLFRRGPNGLIVPFASRQLPVGNVCASSDNDTHQVSNLQSGSADLVTLHIYSPPLIKMDVFSLDTPAVREWIDPINDPFSDGGGI